MTHSPCPASGHVAWGHIAVLGDFERGNQLLFKEPPAPPVICKGRQCFDQRFGTAKGAIGTLEAPNGDDDFFFDAIARLDCIKQRRVLSHGRLAIAHAGV